MSEKQISFRVPVEIAEELKAAAGEEGLKMAPFCRELFVWAVTQHKNAGALLFLLKPELKARGEARRGVVVSNK
jgi:hypothetical protein